MPPRDQILFGTVLALVSAFVLRIEGRIVDETPKGRRLVERVGRPWAVRIVRGTALAFLALGVLLATGIVNPIRW